jgi:S1-C subfamily serine protease
MSRRLAFVLALSVVLIADVGGAVPRPPAPRLHPRDVSPLPTYVRAVEPALVSLDVTASPEAPSSARLGARRWATGVVFDERGYAVTVSYAILDAVKIEAKTRNGTTIPARVVGLDLESGLGVVELEGAGPWRAARVGQSRDVPPGALTGTVGVDSDNDLVWVTSVLRSVRRFSASWEYMLERGLLVAPSTASWSGNAVVNDRGEVIGIVSLRLGEEPYVNMAIPAELLSMVKDELIAAGRVVSRRPRPWIGVYTSTETGGVVVEGFASTGPARKSELREGDRILRVNGVAVRSQEEFYEQLWLAQAGDVIQISVRRADGVRVIPVPSIDRYRLYRPSRN